jgi:hypothetical protein
VGERSPLLVQHGEAVGEQRCPILCPQRIVRAIDFLLARHVAIWSTADERHCIVVARDRRPGRAAKQWTARQQAVVEEQHPREKRLAVIASKLDGGSEAMTGTFGLIALGALRAPLAATPFRQKLATADPSLIAAV